MFLYSISSIVKIHSSFSITGSHSHYCYKYEQSYTDISSEAIILFLPGIVNYSIAALKHNFVSFISNNREYPDLSSMIPRTNELSKFTYNFISFLRMTIGSANYSF